MSQIKIKVCGMRDKDNINLLLEYPVDFMGFIFYKKSKRYIQDLKIKELEIPSTIKKVGVFVNEHSTNILELAEKHQLDIIQLHGTEKPHDCRTIKNEGYLIIKAFGINSSFDWNVLTDYKDFVDFFLFDTQSSQYGGTGKTFDWEILKKYTLHTPYFLSGGIGLDNIIKTFQIKDSRLYALDINSKFEDTPGIKNIKLIDQLFKRILI